MIVIGSGSGLFGANVATARNLIHQSGLSHR